MDLVPPQGEAEGEAALVAGHDLHHRGFADDHRLGPGETCGLQRGDHRRGAGAADLFVGGEHDLERAAERRTRGKAHGGERERIEALHVGGAAAVKPPVAFGHGEGVRGPVLRGHGHDIGMARQQDAARRIGADPGKEAGFGSVGHGHDHSLHALAGKPVCGKGDEIGIAVGADRGEGHEPVEQGGGGGEVGHVRGSVAGPGWRAGRQADGTATRGQAARGLAGRVYGDSVG